MALSRDTRVEVEAHRPTKEPPPFVDDFDADTSVTPVELDVYAFDTTGLPAGTVVGRTDEEDALSPAQDGDDVAFLLAYTWSLVTPADAVAHGETIRADALPTWDDLSDALRALLSDAYTIT